MEIRSCEGGGGDALGVVTLERKNNVCVSELFIVSPLTAFLVIIEMDVCGDAINLQDRLFIKQPRQPGRWAAK